MRVEVTDSGKNHNKKYYTARGFMKYLNVCILGGSGFVGSHLAGQLSKQGYLIKVLSRHPQKQKHLKVFPHLKIIQADVHNPHDLETHFAGCDVVINLVGILNEKGDSGKGFRKVHVELMGKILDACKITHVKRLLHVSALNASAANGKSHYLRSKGEVEALIRNAVHLDSTVFRPSVIFGADDSFINRFSDLLQSVPFVFPLACPDARFAPVYVGDVVTKMIDALEDPNTIGQTYDLCGPKEYTLREIVDTIQNVAGLNRLIINLSDRLSRMQASAMNYVPGKPFSTDNYKSLQVDSICSKGNVCKTTLEEMLPLFLGNQRKSLKYQAYRRSARR
jgi:NADH dehydrogenase